MQGLPSKKNPCDVEDPFDLDNLYAIEELIASNRQGEISRHSLLSSKQQQEKCFNALKEIEHAWGFDDEIYARIKNLLENNFPQELKRQLAPPSLRELIGEYATDCEVLTEDGKNVDLEEKIIFFFGRGDLDKLGGREKGKFCVDECRRELCFSLDDFSP